MHEMKGNEKHELTLEEKKKLGRKLTVGGYFLYMNVLWSPKRKVKCVAFGMDLLNPMNSTKPASFP